jgi:hypothetical protein
MQPIQQEQVYPPLPPHLSGLSDQEYKLWLHNPITKVVWAFLSDKREDLQDQTLSLILSDSLDMDTARELRGRIWCLTELQDLPLAAIKSFYGVAIPEAEKAEDNA